MQDHSALPPVLQADDGEDNVLLLRNPDLHLGGKLSLRRTSGHACAHRLVSTIEANGLVACKI
jgi:hypothetical protein